MKKILISGASVAGPALAHWLHRYGFDVTLVERSASIRDGGYAVDVRGAAIEVLERMRLADKARTLQCDTLGTTFVLEDGKPVADLPRGFGVIDSADLELMRGDLVQLLYEATRNDVRYLFDDSITAIAQDADGVQVTFSRAAPARFDLVVGADGVHSNVRRLSFGAEQQYVFPLGGYMAVFTVKNLLQLDRWQLVQNMPGRVVSFKTVNGNHEARATVFFSSPALDIDSRDLAKQKQVVTQAFADAGWVIPQLLAEMLDASDFYFDTTCQIRMDSWSSGRVALLGDAAACPSPLSGQGSSLALVGAYVLAGELARARAEGAGHAAALAGYERAMRDYVDENQTLAASMADSFAPKTKRALWGRNLSLAMLRYLPGKNWLLKAMMGGLARAANAIELKDYRSFERDTAVRDVAA